MAIVKGTKQRRVKVIEDRPILKIFVFALFVVGAILSVFYSHGYGYSQGMAGQSTAQATITHLQESLALSRSKTDSLEQQLANTNLGAEVDRKASEEIRQEVIALKSQIAQLQEENSFYRGLMAPTKNKRGLTFGAVELSQTDRARRYSYKVVMQQLATNHQLLNGYLEYRVVGRLAGADTTYTLNQLSSEIETRRIRLRFKYFQTIEGEFDLPELFEPMAIELVAQSSGKNPVTVEKRFGWLVEEVL